MRWLLVLLAVAACKSPRPVTASKPPAVRPPATLDPAAIDAWMTSELGTRGVVGASLVVVHEGAVVLARGYGTREIHTREPIDADTPFAIGSVSKQITCAATLLLADDGKLRMDDKVAKYYPNLVRAADITLEDLGAHMAGYRDYYPLDYLDSRMAKPIAPDDLIAKYAGMPIDFEPRSRWSYSNTGFVILARVVERVAGMPFGSFVQQRIFNPLKMAHSSAGLPPPGAAVGHNAFLLGRVERADHEADGWLVGAAGVYASASDLARWDLALSTGAILSETARKTMTTPRRTTDGRTMAYGCGLGVRFDRSGETLLAHTGAIEGFFAYNTFVPRTRSAVILLVNDARYDLSDVHGQIVQLVLQRPQDIPVIPGPPAEEVARQLVRQLQTGALDRTRLGDDLNAFWDDKRVADAAARLRELGGPTITLTDRHERGAMEVTSFDIAFAKETVHAVMFRAPTGKIHQFLITP